MEETINMGKIYTELKKIEDRMVTKEEINRLLETLEIMSNEGTMNQISSSEKDVELGRTKEINSVSDI